jgi:dTDP-4-dehydrorhamnose reductase
MNKILITGSTGLLGSTLTPYLRQCGYHVVSHSRSTNADVVFDLIDSEATYEILCQIKPSAIINLVGLTDVDYCENHINLAYLVNTRVVENLVRWISCSAPSCHLIQVSTDHVYDGLGPHGEGVISLTNNYALSKYAGELAAAHIPSTILRTNFSGRSKTMRRVSFTDWVYKSLKNCQQFSVLDDVFFSPLSIETLSEMIELVLQKRPIGIFNLGSHDGFSKADFCFAFAERLGLSTMFMNRITMDQANFYKSNRPKDMRMDSKNFQTKLAVTLPNLNQVIDSIASEYYENP